MFGETFSEAWEKRYGAKPLEEFDALAPFLRHRSVRKFRNELISENLISGLIAVAQSAATSSNLQLWTVISVQDLDRRETLATLSGDQNQIREAAWFLTFFADHHRLRYAAKAHGLDPEGLEFVEFYTMAVVDASLAAERLVVAAESLGLGICYIGSLRNQPDKVAEVLNLPDGVFGLFGLCIGWPAEETAEIKPRLSQAAVWFQESYNSSPDTAEYDNRMKDFYEAQQMKGDVTWSARSARRATVAQMNGRDGVLKWLRDRRFLRK